jgi:MFS family permease
LGGGLAILISPFVLGWLADQLSLQQAFGIVALLLVTAIIVTFLTGRLVTFRRSTLEKTLPRP